MADESHHDAWFQVSTHRVGLNGQMLEILGVEVIVDEEFTESDRGEILTGLRRGLSQLHPRLRGAIGQIVVPDTHDPSGEAGAATACTSTRQICLWSNRNRPDIQDPGLLPQTSSELLAHESAHLLFPTGGPPDFDEWRAAIDADGPNHYGYRYVDDAIECYAVDQHEREDWANAVAMLHESVRDDEAHLDELRVGSQGFRDGYPNRARIIDRLLAASSEGATSPTMEH